MLQKVDVLVKVSCGQMRFVIAVTWTEGCERATAYCVINLDEALNVDNEGGTAKTRSDEA